MRAPWSSGACVQVGAACMHACVCSSNGLYWRHAGKTANAAMIKCSAAKLQCKAQAVLELQCKATKVAMLKL
eukprot:1161791-Pelagomonas_calceolata.AAC.5